MPLPTLSEMHSKKPFHRLGKVRVNLTAGISNWNNIKEPMSLGISKPFLQVK